MAARPDLYLPPPTLSIRLTATGNEAGIRKLLADFEGLVGNHPALRSIYVGGLGIHIVKRLMDQVAYERADERNHLRLMKHLPTR